MTNNLKGTGVAVITPFHKDGSIDFEAFKNILEHLISNGVDYIVAMGTTGESVVLNENEKNAVINFVVEIVDKRVPVVIGVGGNNTNNVLSFLASHDFEDVSAILCVTPYYNKPHQKGLIAHYKMIADNSPVPLMLYNVPDRTGVNMLAETTLQLAHARSNIIGIKEASKDFDQCAQIVKDKPDNFLLISGDDSHTLPLISIGAQGAISVTANAFPKEFSQMVKKALEGNFLEASIDHYSLYDFMTAIFIDGNPAGIKAAMSLLNLSQNYLRLPSVPATRSTYNTIKVAIDKVYAHV